MCTIGPIEREEVLLDSRREANNWLPARENSFLHCRIKP